MTDHNHYLIPTTTFHQSNESANSVVSDWTQGAGYYGRSGGLHSFQYSVTDFEGDVQVQAALVTGSPSEEDWFTVSKLSHVDAETDSVIESVVGNFVWIRAVAELRAGSINSLLMRF